MCHHCRQLLLHYVLSSVMTKTGTITQQSGSQCDASVKIVAAWNILLKDAPAFPTYFPHPHSALELYICLFSYVHDICNEKKKSYSCCCCCCCCKDSAVSYTTTRSTKTPLYWKVIVPSKNKLRAH